MKSKLVLFGLLLICLSLGLILATIAQESSTPIPNTFDEPITSNDNWEPVEHVINDVVMVLVPPGCVLLGDETGDYDETPNEYCFDEPYWIDKFEVTNEQFNAFDGQAVKAPLWTEDLQPRGNISWFEANDFCELRGGYLPTEVEWEYAARGPSNLIYPWGDEFVPDNLVFGGNSGGEPAEVGSIPEGASWVGAMDMAGNFWEWTHSAYTYAYPYDPAAENPENPNIERITRGRSYGNENAHAFRMSNRSRELPDAVIPNYSFRCACEFDCQDEANESDN